jgi:hypothetical protein
MQHGIPAHCVLLLEICHRWQWTGSPFARFDALAQDRLKLLVRGNGQTGINRAMVTHAINLDHARIALTSAYTCVVLILSALLG